MSTASDVANTKRWLEDARAALEGGRAKVEKLKDHVAAAEAELPALEAAVAQAEADHQAAHDNLQDEGAED